MDKVQVQLLNTQSLNRDVEGAQDSLRTLSVSRLQFGCQENPGISCIGHHFAAPLEQSHPSTEKLGNALILTVARIVKRLN